MSEIKYKGLYMVLNELAQFTEEEYCAFENQFKLNSMAKGEEFTLKGQVSGEIAFLSEGILEMIQLGADGDERVFDVFFPNSFVVDFVSFVTQQPSELTIKAITPAQILVIRKSSLDQLYESSIKYQKIGRLLAEGQFVNLVQRIREASLSPIERYEKLVNEKPYWIRELPQYKIASYLNITPEWLSKLRAK